MNETGVHMHEVNINWLFGFCTYTYMITDNLLLFPKGRKIDTIRNDTDAWFNNQRTMLLYHIKQLSVIQQNTVMNKIFLYSWYTSKWIRC